jgi:hypothetical protein
MKAAEKRKFLIDRFIARQNKASKWYRGDVQDFKNGVMNVPDSTIDEMYSNAVALDSPAFEAMVAKEERRMDRAGMYSPGNMKPKNALD